MRSGEIGDAAARLLVAAAAPAPVGLIIVAESPIAAQMPAAKVVTAAASKYLTGSDTKKKISCGPLKNMFFTENQH